MEEDREPVEAAQKGTNRRDKLSRHNTIPLLGINDSGDDQVNILMEGYPHSLFTHLPHHLIIHTHHNNGK